jgi:hypothetical protein
MWPGIIATSAKIFSSAFNFARFDYLAIGLLILIGLILTLGPSLYKTVESFQKYLILIGVPVIVVIVALIAKASDYSALARGVVGVGEGYRLLPHGIPLFTFLGALAYSGAGGNLNLSQSFYIKEKGYGMCHGAVGIASILSKKANKITIYGRPADYKDPINKTRSRAWWKLVNTEHFLVFLQTGALTILLLRFCRFQQLGVIQVIRESIS